MKTTTKGYDYGCSCGRRHLSPEDAWNCYGCRILPDGSYYSRRVTDLRTGADVPLEWSNPTSIEDMVGV